jgi:hypothetical protein
MMTGMYMKHIRELESGNKSHYQNNMNLEFAVERLLPCECLALTDIPWESCRCCAGTGESYQEIILDIEFTQQKASRGHRDKYGAPEEPDEPECVEIESVKDPAGKEVELTKFEQARVEEKCFERIEASKFDFADHED